MQTRQVVLRECCALVTVFARHRRFLLGATATRELGIPPLARAVRLVAVCGLLAALSARAVWAQTYVTVTVEVDNCAAVYSGTASGSTITAVSLDPTSGPGNAVAYQFLMTPSDEYLYIAAWSDDRGQQGLLAEVSVGGNLVLSGSAAHWEVFATGSNLDNCAIPQPTLASIGAQIAGAVWVPIAVGGPPGNFPLGCGSAAAWNAAGAGFTAGSNWMWSPPIVFPGPFCPGADHGEYLIFRTKIQCVPPPPGMVAWWTLDDPNAGLSGNDQPIALDSVPNPLLNNGAHIPIPVNNQVVGPVFVPAGWVGGALSTGYNSTYGPTGGHVRVPDAPELDITPSGFTVAIWYKCAVCIAPSPQSIIRKMAAAYSGVGYILEVGPGPGGYCWGVGGTNASGTINDGLCVTSTCIPGSWNHLAMTVTAALTNGTKVYLNGILDSGGQGITTGSNNEPLLIGTYFPTPCSTELDEVQIWSRALSPIEINDIVNAGSGGKCKCEPLANGLGCKATICPDPNDICKPTQLVKDTITNQTRVTQCDCVNVNDCSIVNPSLCTVGTCPFTNNTVCPMTPTATQNIDYGVCDLTTGTGLCVGGLNPGAPCTTDLQCPDLKKIRYECCPKDKCRHHCHDVPVSTICPGATTLVVQMEACNECDEKQAYTLAFAGVPFVPNRICNGPLLIAADFTILNPLVMPLQNACHHFDVTIKIPPTLLKGQVSCYTLTMTNNATGNVFACHGSVRRINCCNDERFCNGLETSDPNGDCIAGDPPCAVDFLCDEEHETCLEAIPTVSQWGLVVLTLLLLIGAKIYFARRRTATGT